MTILWEIDQLRNGVNAFFFDFQRKIFVRYSEEYEIQPIIPILGAKTLSKVY
jgi:hypothetical protein